ncbi:TPA: fimbria/pilus outer membrane usher protein [Serratia marcescens]|uniref:fimbria/pilus outer membrane usher protein n=1 Tax=Serratia marcescens TaxID=615 RepID=UPI001588F7AC|nr:fimbria/pilus outer membrane usher protein [Serratia marcescens]
MLALMILPGGGLATSVNDDAPLYFDPELLAMGGRQERTVDLTYFTHKGGQLPGRYTLRVEVNGRPVDDGREVDYRSSPTRPGRLYACVTAAQWANWWGIVVPVPDGGSDAPCPAGGLETLVPYARERVDINRRLLSLTVPQAALGAASRLRTPPVLWDTGLPALLMNYTYSGTQQRHAGQGGSGSDFLGLNGQLNLLGWRLRNDLSGHRNQGEGVRWSVSQGYAQHDVAALGGAQLTVGHTTTLGNDGGESVLFNGVKLVSDPGMLDPTFARWRPTISGTALSPATVTVRQYGKVIYETNVPQGPFSLTEFNRSGNAEISVDIREADGRTRHFTLVQADAGMRVPQDAYAFSLATGLAANGAGYIDNRFLQASGTYGVRESLSLTAGNLLSSSYQALSLGASGAVSAWGALNYTLTAAHANLAGVPGKRGGRTGVSHTLSGSRNFGDTAVTLSASRSQNAHYYRYAELLSLTGEEDVRAGDSRDSIGLSLSHAFGRGGTLSLSGSHTTAWGEQGAQQTLTAGYTATVRDIGIGLSLGINRTHGRGADPVRGDAWSTRHTDTTLMVTLSLPLDKWLYTGSGLTGSYTYANDDGTLTQQAGVTGSALAGALTYAAAGGISGARLRNASLGYSGRYGGLNGGVSDSTGGRSLTYGARGGLAIHAQGVTPGRALALDGANALVAIPGIRDVSIGEAVTDERGYALLSGLTPFDANRISVDMSTLPGDVELDVSSRNVIPARGALVSVPFRGNQGYRLLLTLMYPPDGVPFGSTVTLHQAEATAPPVTGVVGDEGQVYLTGMPPRGTLTATWGDDARARCTASYTLPVTANRERLQVHRATCRSGVM